MGKNSNTPVPYFLMNPNGLEEVRNFQKDLHTAVDTLQQKMARRFEEAVAT